MTQEANATRSGTPAAGDLLPAGGAIGRQGRPQAGGAELRRGEAPGAVPAGGQAAPPRPGAVSLSPQGASQRHLRRRLHDAVPFAFRVWRAYGYIVYTLKANGTLGSADFRGFTRQAVGSRARYPRRL